MAISKKVIINLPSFLRRVMKAYALKALIREVDCDLYRIGRSRNWQIKTDLSNISELIRLIEQEDEPSWLWFSKLLREKNENLSHEQLIDLAKRKPGITLSQLVTLSDCTIAQARKVIDELEDLDK